MGIGTRHSALGGSAKGPVLLVVAIVALGVAGYLAYQHFAQGSAEQAALDKYESGMAWKQRISRTFARDEGNRFQRVQLAVLHDETDKADHFIEIAGLVSSQADLDALNALLKQGDLVPPIRHTFTVTVDKSTPPPPPAG